MDTAPSLARAIAALHAEPGARSATVTVPGAPVGVGVHAPGCFVTLEVGPLSHGQKAKARSVFMGLGAHPAHVDRMTAHGRLEHGFAGPERAAEAVTRIADKVFGVALGASPAVVPD